MDCRLLNELRAPAGQEILAAAEALNPTEGAFLAQLQMLQRRFRSELASAALEIAILRREAAGKFPFASGMYFTRQALEQASNWEISTYRAERYRGFDRLADLGCSVGGDSLALGSVAGGVALCVGLDRDRLRLAMAQANAAGLGDRTVEARLNFLHADLTAALPLTCDQPALALFFDPARRAGHRRAFSIRDYSPPLSLVQDWLPRCPVIGVKISPGVDLDELAGYDCEIEFISLRGELKEAVLWFGALKSVQRRATLLPGRHSLASERALRPTFHNLSQPANFIYEPDPAILRAGLVTMLAERLNAAQLDPDIAYLTADTLAPTPFARAWAIEAWFPFQLKRLRAYLREHHIGQVVVKKRGSPLTPEALIRDLRLNGQGQSRTLFLTHWQGKPVVLVGQETEPAGAALLSK